MESLHARWDEVKTQGSQWSKEEDAQLLRCIDKGLTTKEISENHFPERGIKGMVYRLSSIRPPGLWAEEGQLDRRKSTGVCVEENPTQAAWIRLLSCEHGINHLMSLREREYGLSDMQITEKEIEFVLRLMSLCDVNISFDLNVPVTIQR
jgi:hypothetical protein